MEAKVDVRKLQILNDRINQTIDALSQVRMSVHGLGHTGVPTPTINPFMPPGLGYPTVPFQGIPPVPPIPYGAIPPIPPIPGLFGLSHSPYTPPVNPFFNVPTPFTTPFVDPIELRLLETRALDPVRIRETFPFFGIY